MCSKKSNNCNKCQKEFTSEYLLHKHINRKISCDIVLTCKICGKVFKQPHHLEQHKNKKNPCKIKKITIIEEQKEILQYKHSLELEIIKAKKESALEIEYARTNRKEKTPQIINTKIINTQNNIVNNFNVPFPDKGVISATLLDCKYSIKRILKDIDETDAINKVYFSKDIQKLPIEFINNTYNNDKYPHNKNMWYNKNLNTFYCVINEQWAKADIEIIRNIIENTIRMYYDDLCNKSKIFTPKKSEQENRRIILQSANKIIYKPEYYDNIAKEALNYP
jgi:hypothetical protein